MFVRRQPTFVVILMVAIALPTRSLRAQPFDPEYPSPIELERPRWLPTDGDLEALSAAFDVPGLALVGLANCTVTPAITVGAAPLDPATPVTGTTLFEAASLSKPVFAYLVMQLVDEGALDLDRPLAHDFAYPRIEEHENYARITPRMILAHRTGLPNWVGDTDDPDRTDRIAFVAPPGTRFSYSGEAYELLRRYVEFITDRTLDELFREQEQILDLDARKEIMNEVQAILAEEAPMLFLAATQGYVGVKDRWHNIMLPPAGSTTWNIDEIWTPDPQDN